MDADPITAFISARLAEEQPREVCGCYDANHWPPCTAQPWADRKRREIAAYRRILARHQARPDGMCAAHPYISADRCPGQPGRGIDMG